MKLLKRKLILHKKKFYEIDEKITVAESKLSELEKMLHEDYFTGLLDKEWEKRKIFLTKELEEKQTILINTMDNELEKVHKKITDVFQQFYIHRKEYSDKLNERGNTFSKCD